MANKMKDESPLSAFDGLLSNISGEDYQSDSSNLDGVLIDKGGDGVTDLSKSDIDDTDIDVSPLLKDEEDEEDIKNDSSKDDDDSEVDDEPTKPAKNKKDKDVDFSDEADDEIKPDAGEAGQVGLFFDAFSEALGWEIDGEEKKPNTIDGLIDYMRDLIEENTEVEYADDRIKELDDFVKNGGKFEDYYTMANEITDLDKLDLEDEDNQKAVTREYLKANGYSDAQINKKIQRWDDAGVLEEEAKESLELLKGIKSKQKEAQLQQQQTHRLEQEKAQKAFYTEIETSIEGLKEIRGIKVTPEDRKKLKEYSLKFDSDGKTKYLKEYEKNVAKNFVESAFFTMKGDAFVKSAKQSGETSAVARLRQSMKSSKVGNSKHDMDNSSATPIWKAASSFLRG